MTRARPARRGGDRASGPADPVRAARDAALKLLASRDLSRVELSAMLVQKKHSPEAAAAAVEELAALGLQSDGRVAEGHVRARLSACARARTLLELELERRGIEAPAAAAALDALLEGRDESRDALAIAREQVKTAPARMAPQSVLRRAFASLIRRGYDEETARQAVEAAGEEFLGRP
ncbi:MAG: RecX family transcriptional regulator [Phycisphaerales bacterium]